MNRPLHVTEVMALARTDTLDSGCGSDGTSVSEHIRRAVLTRAGLHRTRVNGTDRDLHMTTVCGLWSPGDHWPIPGQPRLPFNNTPAHGQRGMDCG